MDDQGHPLLAEYDSNGRFVDDVGHLGLGELEDVTLYPATSWWAFEMFQQILIAANPDATQGAILLSAEQQGETGTDLFNSIIKSVPVSPSNMESLRGSNWPQERLDGPYVDRWLHSDIKNIGMPYIYPIYEEMLKEGGFVHEN
ncbi:MAG: hypothetical protein E2O57_04235 [Gammaproteobacteria bacterium]|nr:MAG: hypothetical protein E2O57_04235 [Gammaproteobacteria bacterium]